MIPDRTMVKVRLTFCDRVLLCRAADCGTAGRESVLASSSPFFFPLFQRFESAPAFLFLASSISCARVTSLIELFGLDVFHFPSRMIDKGYHRQTPKAEPFAPRLSPFLSRNSKTAPYSSPGTNTQPLIDRLARETTTRKTFKNTRNLG